MSRNLLVVPMVLDILLVEDERGMLVVGPAADFSSLPYLDRYGKRDMNADTANVSEAVLAKPFMNRSLLLRRGAHLHWTLDDALCRRRPSGGRLATEDSFPRVPNRWLVTRRKGEAIEEQWVVESDYLFPPGTGNGERSVTFPWRPAASDPDWQPFRRVGRKMPLKAWRRRFEDARYLDRLTALGYGTPNFAAFYPNCFSLFGLHDEEIFSAALAKGVEYDVLGWYADEGQDEIRALLAGKRAEEAVRTLEVEAGWKLSSGAAKPDGMVCFGRIAFGAPVSTKDSPISVALACSPTEALSARLAEDLAGSAGEREFLENLYEAVQQSYDLSRARFDVLPRFLEARHLNAFAPVEGERTWTIRSDERPVAGKELEPGKPWPAEWAPLVKEANSRQRRYDRGLAELEGLRRQVFADWYKYMAVAYPPLATDMAAYPSLDRVKRYLESGPLRRLREKTQAVGVLVVPRTAGEAFRHEGVVPGSLAESLAAALNALRQATARAGDAYRIQPESGARYWQPRDPVVLLSGDRVKMSDRYGRREPLACRVAAVDDWNSADELAAARKAIAQAAAELRADRWEGNPWNPYLLEWQVQVFPLKGKGEDGRSNLNSASGRYGAGFISKIYEATFGDPDLTVRRDYLALDADKGSIYLGTTFLTNHPQLQLLDRIKAHFRQDGVIERFREPLRACFGERAEVTVGDLQKRMAALWESADARKAFLAAASRTELKAVCALVRAYDRLAGMSILAQSLGGFHEALLMRRRTLEFEPADPLAFDEYRGFTDEEIRRAVEDGVKTAPQPLTYFNPIRTGYLKLLRLRIVDNFGQVHDVDVDAFAAPEAMRVAGNPGLAALPPRFAQPARLDFRWLAAEGGHEVHAHPLATPVCGWIVVNRFDRSLLVFDADGGALGEVTDAGWLAAPESATARATPADVAQPALRRLVESLAAAWREQPFRKRFIEENLEPVLETILPEGDRDFQSLSLMVSRPLAVVRARVGISLWGPPAVNQDWAVFQRDLRRNRRETDGFTGVKVPVRLGRALKMNDGLALYWLEDRDGGFRVEDFRCHSRNETSSFDLSIDDGPRTCLMLVEPHGSVNAAAGILPNKEIDLPPAHVRRALESIEVSFLAAPMLVRRGEFRLPLPEQQDYAWSWLERARDGGWTRLPAALHVRRGDLLKALGADAALAGRVRSGFGAASDEAVWAELLRRPGWIARETDELAWVLEGKAGSDVAPELNAAVTELLLRCADGIRSSDGVARLEPGVQIREGWLKAGRAKQNSKGE